MLPFDMGGAPTREELEGELVDLGYDLRYLAQRLRQVGEGLHRTLNEYLDLMDNS